MVIAVPPIQASLPVYTPGVPGVGVGVGPLGATTPYSGVDQSENVTKSKVERTLKE